jgi:DNA-binding winged helix-turn-helix (wHTH) protein
MMGLPDRAGRLLTLLVAARGSVSSDLLVREASAGRLTREIARARAALRRLGAPGSIETAHGLGYRITPELRAWVNDRVSA